MSLHTPAPLEVRLGPHPESDVTSAEYTAGLLRGTGQVFVVVAPDPERPAPDYLVTAVTGDGPASEANALLYAAAPDLYEVAALVLNLGPGNYEYLRQRASAAIAKAEGK